MNERWKWIKGYEGLYSVSDKGRIKSFRGWNGHEYIRRVKVISPYTQRVNGEKTEYARAIVKLRDEEGNKKEFKVHRLVAEAFIPNPNGYAVVNHLDGNPINNNVNNLEWCTQKHNIRHAIETGSRVSRINTIDRETMVDFLNYGKTYDEIAEILGIAKGTVCNYIRKFKIKKIYI